MKRFVLILVCLLPAKILAENIYECHPPLDTEAKAKECSMWHSRIISEFSRSGYDYNIVERETQCIVRHTNRDKNGSTYKVLVNKSDGKLVELSRD